MAGISCVAMDGSTLCPGFSGFTALIGQAGATTAQDLDHYISGQISSDTSDLGVFAGHIALADQCSGYTGTGLRYHTTIVCAIIATEGITGGCQTAPAAVPVCQSTLATFFASWDSTFGNPAICPTDSNSTDINLLKDVFSVMSGSLSNAQNCMVGVPAETVTCGFGSQQEQAAFCAGSTDACCASLASSASSLALPSVSWANTTSAKATALDVVQTLAVPLPLSPSTPSPSVSDASSSQSEGSSFPLSLVAGVAGGAALLLLILLGVFFCARNSRARKQVGDIPRREPEKYNDFKKYRDIEVPEVPYPAPIAELSTIYSAIYDFEAQQQDNLSVLAGDKINLKQEYDDGWGYGKNTRTMLEGYFPLEILDSFTNKPKSVYRSSEYSQRSSSIYNAGPVNSDYHETFHPVSNHQVQNNNTDSMYYTESEAPTNSIYMPEPSPPTYVENTNFDEVILDFEPERNDEVELRVGDHVVVKRSFDDGWCVGVNLATQREGYFPQDCLASYENNTQVEKQEGGKNQRSSSLYLDDQQSSVQQGSLVVYDYVAERDDEVTLQTKDRVLVKEEYDDGWGYGINLTTRKEGVFPLDCIEGSSHQPAGDASSNHGQRNSSMYVPKNTMSMFTTATNDSIYDANVSSVYSAAGNPVYFDDKH